MATLFRPFFSASAVVLCGATWETSVVYSRSFALRAQSLLRQNRTTGVRFCLRGVPKGTNPKYPAGRDSGRTRNAPLGVRAKILGCPTATAPPPRPPQPTLT